MSPALTDLALGRSVVDRAAELRTDVEWWSGVAFDSETRVIVLRDAAMLMTGEAIRFARPSDVTTPDHAASELAFLGRHEEINYAVLLTSLDEQHPFMTSEWQTLRSVGASLTDLDAGLATTAVALQNWHRTHTHCPRCGASTFVTNAGWVRQCPSDGSEHYPRTDGAVIVAIVDETERLLLARQSVWQPGHFSIVAGFVEPGETFEAAVAREALEEVGIVVTDIEYLGSQPWPFPASLMIGCRARAVGSDITVDGTEIEEARWFSRVELVTACEDGSLRLPSRVSIARRIIEHWYGEELPNEWSRP